MKIEKAKKIVKIHSMIRELDDMIKKHRDYINHHKKHHGGTYSETNGTMIWYRGLKRLRKAMQRGLGYYMGNSTAFPGSGMFLLNEYSTTAKDYLIRNSETFIRIYGKGIKSKKY